MAEQVWADAGDAHLYWGSAPENPDLLDMLLGAAQVACEAYAPALAAEDEVPVNYTVAVVLQASELFNAVQRDGDVIGFSDSGYAVQVRPLSSTVKALLRPRRAVPRVG